LPEVQRLAPCAFDSAKDPDHKVLSVVPYAAGLIKLHKSPYAFRFLACSKDNGLRQPALWVTSLLRAVHVDLQQIWKDVLTPTGVPWADAPAWFINDSALLAQCVARFNTERMPAAEFERGGGWQGADVVRLYTNIPHDLLLTALDWAIDKAWAQHPNQDVLMVYKSRSETPVWLPGFDDRPSTSGYTWVNPRRGRHATKGACYLFDKVEAKAMVELLVRNSYVRLGEAVYKQTCGIPMGINPAVFMANYFLFYYEYRFVAQLTALIGAHPVSDADMAFATTFFARDLGTPDAPAPWLTQPVTLASRVAALAHYVLHCFRNTVHPG